jgi:hypothetical protein
MKHASQDYGIRVGKERKRGKKAQRIIILMYTSINLQ